MIVLIHNIMTQLMKYNIIPVNEFLLKPPGDGKLSSMQEKYNSNEPS